MLAELRLKGMHLMPGVPNTTPVPLTRSSLSSRHVRQEVERVDNGGKGHLQLKELE